MVHIEREDVPCWYEISLSADAELAFLIRLHEDVVEEVFDRAQSWPIVAILKEEYKFESFRANSQQGFGFDNFGLVASGIEDKFLRLRLPLPSIEKAKKEVCVYCGGKKKDTIRGGPCAGCRGLGVRGEFDARLALRMSISLNLFLNKVSSIEAKSSATSSQLMVVETNHERGGLQSNPIAGAFSRPFVKWLSVTKPITANQTVAAMCKVYNYMWWFPRRLGDCFAQIQSDGRLSLTLSPDRCAIDPENGSWHDIEKGRGYKFTCHNVATIVQQWTLLAGLASLCDEARKQ